MHKLLMTSALVVPLLVVPAYAQQEPQPQPEGGAVEGTAPTPEAGATEGQAVDEPQVEVQTEEPNVEVTQEEPQVEVVQEPPQVEVIREGEAEGEAPAVAGQPEAEQPDMAQEPAAGEPEMAEEPAAETAEGAQPVPEPVVSEMSPDELRGDWVIGTDVTSPEDETIGQIEDVIITPDGQISAAVLSVGGFLGLGAKNIAVDWSELEIAQDGQEIMLDLTREEAEAAPEYAFRDQAQPEQETQAPATTTAPAATTTQEPAAPAQ